MEGKKVLTVGLVTNKKRWNCTVLQEKKKVTGLKAGGGSAVKSSRVDSTPFLSKSSSYVFRMGGKITLQRTDPCGFLS